MANSKNRAPQADQPLRAVAAQRHGPWPGSFRLSEVKWLTVVEYPPLAAGIAEAATDSRHWLQGWSLQDTAPEPFQNCPPGAPEGVYWISSFEVPPLHVDSATLTRPEQA